ncbi:MAG: LLM class flavin-dependent oxidoreductase [Proteobacteria bacterium]|nr:LLM class flavin-dependent oxidoreductase [Pseudomonadota bacterium]
MKFALSLNMERLSSSEDMRDVVQHALTMVQIAEDGGFHSAWSAEHHTIELTIGPNPLSLLIHWGQYAKKIRLGTAILVAPYWHPIRAAGEAALTDLYIDGRLEFGIGRGAFQWEFDRLAGGMPQEQGGDHMREMLPAILELWKGDYTHNGEIWQFPKATSVPKPLQKPYPPVWVAARDPASFDFSMKMCADIMSTPLSRPFDEVELYAERLATAVRENPTVPHPRWCVLRRAFVYEDEKGADIPVQASIDYGRRFENLFGTGGTVDNGFPELIPLDKVRDGKNYDPDVIRDAMIFGTPDQVMKKCELYENVGVDILMLGVNFGLDPADERKSLELFIKEVAPHFAKREAEKAKAAQ